MQVNDLPRVATQVPAVPGVSWLSRPSASLGTILRRSSYKKGTQRTFDDPMVRGHGFDLSPSGEENIFLTPQLCIQKLVT